ncbi:MAG: PilC/PilY family type IV pilus protein [Lautropia sp.]|nr:PilC/PilY family type IV pilus protein [Lautropia sp.]
MTVGDKRVEVVGTDSGARCPGVRAGAGRAVQLALVWMASMAWLPAQAEVAQHSLVVVTPPVVEPNIMFTLDDSGSMAFNTLPDSDPMPGLYAFHPDELKKLVGSYDVAGLLDTADDNILSMRKRSSDVNLLYYNPKVSYKPWLTPKGEKGPDANPKAAHYFYGHEGDVTVNLEGEIPVGQNFTVCAPPTQFPQEWPSDWQRTNAVGQKRYTKCEKAPNRPTTIKPATYYVLQPGKDPWKLDSYKRVSIADMPSDDATIDIETTEREECAVKSIKVRSCTRRQEYQNFANWYQYYRTRYLLAVAAVGEAFNKQLGSDVRVGYGSINKVPNKTSRYRDYDFNKVIKQGVQRFGQEQKSQFLTWLQQLTPNGGTPLRLASIAVGEYFRGDEPWTDQDRRGRTRRLSCRRSYHILMTDGQYNDGQDGDTEIGRHGGMSDADTTVGPEIYGNRRNRLTYQYNPKEPGNQIYPSSASNSLGDIAMYYWKNDLRPDIPNNIVPDKDDPSFWQNLTMYTLSFGVDGLLKAGTTEQQAQTLKDIAEGKQHWPERIPKESPQAIDDLWHAAVNSHGRYLNVKNSTEFLASMRQILAEIVDRTGTTAGVSVSSRALQVDNQKFVPSFTTRSWTGDLQSYLVNDKGEQGKLQWSAANKMRHWSLRKGIVGNGEDNGTKANDFYWIQGKNGDLSDKLKQDLMDSFGWTGKRDNVWEGRGRQLVAYLMGDTNYENQYFRPRRGALGQIVNSSPIFLGAATNQGYAALPAEVGVGGRMNSSGRDGYKKFVTEKEKRQKLVVVGANDGFVHVFRASDGVERMAYAPRVVVMEMARLARKGNNEHRFLMDGPLVEADAYLDGHWQNLVVGTTGAGPAAVFALDMTRTADKDLGTRSFMWELDAKREPSLGHVLSAPEVGMLRDGTWVAVFGNGYDSADARAKLLVVDVKTGRVLKVLDTGRGSKSQPNGLGGVKLLRDGNQVITAAYAGDLFGNMWKFDLSGDRNAWKVSFGGRPLFTDAGRRPFTAAPALVQHPRGGTMVLAGTGKLFEEGDEAQDQQDSLYGLWDDSTLVQQKGANGASQTVGWQWKEGTSISSDKLVVRRQNLNSVSGLSVDADANKVLDWSKDRGWQIPLDMSVERGLRLIVQPQLVSGMALFESMTPVVGTDYVDNPCADLVNVPGFSHFVDPITGGMSTKQIIDTNKDGKVNGDDGRVSGWRVENWTGRSVVLSEAPPKPCANAKCTEAKKSTLCPDGSLASVSLTADSRQVLCVGVPPPSRWWWRELTVPDHVTGAGS